MWNPVLELVVKIKNEYKERFGLDTYDFKRWLERLDNIEYNNIFEGLQINQEDKIILIRYGIADIQKGLWEDKNSIYRECRSVVIDLEEECLVLTPFRKFFNLNEVYENKLENIKNEIAEAKVFEITDKLDGSMQVARYYKNDIFMSGSMAINKKNSWRLEDGYNKLTNNHKLMIKENPNLTFMFEYISLNDAHVVLYEKKKEGLYLIGIRDVTTGYQYSYKEIEEFSIRYDVPMTKIENYTLDEILALCKTTKANNKEGWVMNIDGHMLKIKCDDYVQLHRLLDKLSSINVIIENIAEGKFDDMISKVPELYKNRVLLIANRIFKYVDKTILEINRNYKLAPKENKKEFMLWVDQNCSSDIKKYVREKYLGREFNVLKKGVVGYKKLKDLGIYEDYSALFSDIEGDINE
ncbi:T4 RnlA family RNA ligase (plasmid) [Clostridium perfringens]